APADADPFAGLADAGDCTVVAFTADPDTDLLDDGPDEGAASPTSPAAGSQVNVAGPLGAQFLLWEVATAVAGRLLGINPFDQPDVESAKKAAREIMEQGALGG